MAALSTSQNRELQLAILDYLRTSGLTAAFESLKNEANLADGYVADGKQKYSGLLEKKWTSVIRLQKKVSRLLMAFFIQHSTVEYISTHSYDMWSMHFNVFTWLLFRSTRILHIIFHMLYLLLIAHGSWSCIESLI